MVRPMDAARSLILRAIGLIAAAGVFVVPIALGDSEPTWRFLGDAPAPRQEVSYVALGGRLYLAAGNDLSQQRYDPATDQWQSVKALPASFESVDHVHAVAVDGRIAYIGGLLSWELPFPVIGTVAIYDPASNTFASGTDMPSPRAAGGVATWNGLVIYAGGLGPNGSVARVDAYDPGTGNWTRLADMPRPRDHFQAVVVGDKLYAIGGRNTFETGSGNIGIEEIAAVDVLDLPADASGLPTATWSTDPLPLPTPRGGHGVVAVGECIYVVGGESESAEPDGVTGSTESFDTVSGEWRTLAPLWVPRHGIEAAAIGKTIYVAAGGTEAFEYKPTAVHEALDVSEQAPCVATEPGEPPDPDPDPEPEPEPQPEQPSGATLPLSAGESPPAPPARVAVLRVRRLAVRPEKVPQGKKASIVVVLSQPGMVTVSLPGHFRLSRKLRVGRNTLPLPLRSKGKLLPPGRHTLRAQARGPTSSRRTVHASFTVIG